MTLDFDLLRPIVDQPDFDEAIRNDSDGSFQEAVGSYLSEWKAIIAGELSKGMAPSEYEALSLFAESLETTSKVAEFLVMAETIGRKSPDLSSM